MVRVHFSHKRNWLLNRKFYKNNIPMTAKDLKIEIQKVLNEVPESQLEDILSYLKGIQNKAAPKFADPQHLEKILTEDKELLKKLAQ